MTNKEKALLLKDLCARLLYHTIVKYRNADVDLTQYVRSVKLTECKPYLRPMSSMTEEEKKVVCSMNMLSDTELNDRFNYQRMYLQNYTIETFDYFNEHHLDYRGLIPMGLALPALEGMYNI